MRRKEKTKRMSYSETQANQQKSHCGAVCEVLDGTICSVCEEYSRFFMNSNFKLVSKVPNRSN